MYNIYINGLGSCSSIEGRGFTMRSHQVLHFKNGEKRTLFNVVGVKDGEFTHLKLADGRKVLVNRRNLLMIEIFNDKDDIALKTWGDMFNVYSANEDGE